MNITGEHLYRGGLWVKAVNGASELIGGILLILVPTHFILNLVAFFAKHDYGLLARALSPLIYDGRGLAVLYLLSHGVVKCVLAALLLRGIRAAYPMAIALFGVLISYELYRLATRPGALIAGIVLLDGVILTLVLVHGRHRGAAPSPELAP